MTVGTVHTLQGAQRRVVVFSPIMTEASAVAAGRRPFFDVSSNMLNVAVSRARDAFVVIGDMALFDAHPDAGFTPSTVLPVTYAAMTTASCRMSFPGWWRLIPICSSSGSTGWRRIGPFLLKPSEACSGGSCLPRPSSRPQSRSDHGSEAAVRGVEVVIYTGLRLGSDAEGKGAGARVHVTTRVHAKTLAVDEDLAVEGSFNWFSSTRDPPFARKESSVALRGSDAAAAVAQIEAEFAALRTTPLPAKGAMLDQQSFARRHAPESRPGA